MSLRLLRKALGRPPFFVDYESNVVTQGSGFAASGDTTSAQIAAPSYTNGLGSYTYAWTKLSGSANIDISATNVERPAFSGTGILDETPENATYEVVVTDVTTGKTASDQVTVIAIWTNLT
jgi:hypothetical protein